MSDRRIILTLRLVLVFLGILLAAESWFLQPNIQLTVPSISIPVIVIPTNQPHEDSSWSNEDNGGYDYSSGWDDTGDNWEDSSDEWSGDGWDDDSGDSGSW